MPKQSQLVSIFTGDTIHILYLEGSLHENAVVQHEKVKAPFPDPGEYQTSVCKLIERPSEKRTGRVWVILRESFPYGSFQEDGSTLSVSSDVWFRQFCEALSPGLFPQRIHSALDVLRVSFSQNTVHWRSGQGIFFEIDEKGYFFGYDEKDAFLRISRNPIETVPGGKGFRTDWLQQTKMLYQNRTGYELTKITYISAVPITPYGREDTGIAVEPYAICDFGRLPGWDLPVTPFDLMSITGPSCSLPRFQLDFLDKRIFRHEVVRGFRGGTMVMLVGGVVFLAAACRGGALGTTEDSQLNERWQSSISDWNDARRMWKDKSSFVRSKRLPVLLAGSIGAQLPEQVQLTRLQVQKLPATGDALELSLEGHLESRESTASFQEWVNRLIESRVVDDVRNITFNPEGKLLEFRLQAISTEGNRS